MDLITSFVDRYKREFDFYDQAARVGMSLLQLRLDSAGVRAIVTSRAKSPIRLEVKIRQRAAAQSYQTMDDIAADIADLAGIRVALYFPGERKQVETIIRDGFSLVTVPKEFPDQSGSPSLSKRFSGYWATHFRAQIKEAVLSDAQKRYCAARVEIQVASVLMHAWAEVEHDLVYKPFEGQLSVDEYAILDELNGLVIAGEIALERLQRAGDARVGALGRRFANHYELAAFLLDRAKPMFRGPLGESALGRVDILFGFLGALRLDNPESVAPYLDGLHADTEKRPVAEQIVDQMLAEDTERYQAYEKIRASREVRVDAQGPDEVLAEAAEHEAIGAFLTEWIALERLVREIAHARRKGRINVFPTASVVASLGVFGTRTSDDIERIRRLRNELVHGYEVPPIEELRSAAARLNEIVAATPHPSVDEGVI
jgi:ppGpp synthetase/RelA/SpoT-type nucleotidyltranferase